MAGIINAAREPEQGAQPGQDVVGNITQGEQPEGQETEQGNPQTQDAYDRVITAFMTTIYDEKIQPEIVSQLQSENPEQAIAMNAINILVRLDEMSGGKIPSEVLIEAGIEGMELIAEMGEAAGFYKFDEAMQAKTVQQMVAIAIERGIIEPQEIEALMQETDQGQMQAMVQQQQQLAGGV